jgi:small subunit ribosomal protein S2
MATEAKEVKTNLDELFKNGAHFGFGKSRRHPSVKNFIYGSKNKTDIFDLEKTSVELERALEFVKKLASEKGQILFVGGKNEAREIVKSAALAIDMPYVAGRWIGGTLTNFPQIRKRVETMLDLKSQKEKGELTKYTKKERLLIDRDIEKLDNFFGGIVLMAALPKALFLVDARYEDTALREATQLGIPVIALCGSDNDLKKVTYPIPGNDSSRVSIKFFTDKIKEAYGNNNGTN